MIKNTRYNDDTKQTLRFSKRRAMALLALLSIGVCAIFTGAVWNSSHALKQITPGQSNVSQQAHITLMRVKQQVAPASSSIEMLSFTLSSYLAGFGSNVGVTVYDATRGRSYTSNSGVQFLTASSIKVPIMLAFFSMTEKQGREPDDDEMSLLTSMIEDSDNDAASTLYVAINGATGLADYLKQIGVTGLEPDSDAWGYSLITPQAMVNLLLRLQNATILTATDRATALDLMQHIAVDQRWGVGGTVPQGATVFMKNGWVPGPDGLWSVNTSGIIKSGNETYIISVYTQGQPSLAEGQAIVQQVCDTVASSLI